MGISKISDSQRLSNQSGFLIDEKSQNFPVIHVIIPVYNESKAIISVINSIQNTLTSLYKFKITVIDDGSSDGTISVLTNSSLNIDVKRNMVNLGKGRTIQRGINLIKKNEIIVFIDGDGEHVPEDIPLLVEPIINNEADIVIGSRFLNTKKKGIMNGSYLKNRKKFSHFRKLGNMIISSIIYIFHKNFISDSQSGFRVFAPDILSKVQLNFSHFEVETELTIIAIKNSNRIKEIPINSGLSSRESHMNIIFDSLKILLVILEMRYMNSKILSIIRNFINRINSH
jgi:glycosyltransferase involved in cell wall biosynthesis